MEMKIINAILLLRALLVENNNGTKYFYMQVLFISLYIQNLIHYN